jgi:protein-disulfide isomerase
VSSARPWCEGQFVKVVSTEGDLYIGTSPWFLDEESGTIEEKLKAFTWKHMQATFTATVERGKTYDGLYKVTVTETTEHGGIPLYGLIDPAGTVFFFGHFYPLAGDIRSLRLKNLEPFITTAPTEGSSKPEVTVIEFSDFQCPACQHASTYLDPIIAKYGDKVRYVRYDVPLMSHHPWAFAAAMAGRAIYHQKPELFWEFKKQIYSNQDKITAFTIDDFARGFAQDHELDLKKYDADVQSDAVREEILHAVGMAFSTDINSTPSYIVNGAIVDPGNDGKALESYVAGLLKK